MWAAKQNHGKLMATVAPAELVKLKAKRDKGDAVIIKTDESKYELLRDLASSIYILRNARIHIF